MKSEWNGNNTKMTYKKSKDQIKTAWTWNQYKMEKSEKTTQINMK